MLRNWVFVAGLVGTTLLGALPATAGEVAGLTIKSGETWLFRIENGQPAGAHKVSDKMRPAKGEIKVEVSASMGTMMTVTNNTDHLYNYRAFMLGKPDAKGQRTSVCTLMSGGGSSFENWPETIPFLRVSDFVEAADGAMVCS